MYLIMRQFRAVLCAMLLLSVTAPAQAELYQYLFLKAGAFLPESKRFDTGSSFEAGYALRPLRYAAAEAAVGYLRAEEGANTLSAIPVTMTVKGILPTPHLNIYAGGGVGTYYKMLSGVSEIPPNASEWSIGYHAVAGIEVPSGSSIFLLEGKYLTVNQGKFNNIDIKHGGAFVSIGFAFPFTSLF